MVEKVNQDNEKPDIPIELPSMDLWSNPCIQFSIKTLTGIGVESPKGRKSQRHKIITGIKQQPVSPLNMDLGDLWKNTCIEFAVKTLTGAIPVKRFFKKYDWEVFQKI